MSGDLDDAALTQKGLIEKLSSLNSNGVAPEHPSLQNHQSPESLPLLAGVSN
jgi:hypothetical protein